MKPSKMTGLRISVSGNVQGVNFRSETQRKAEELEIQGYVKNLESGKVEIEAQGSDEAMQKFLDWLKVGPAASDVEDVKSTPVQMGDYSGFEIVR
ncbi:MAG: acylphosphatase [Bacteroidia bacterium]